MSKEQVSPKELITLREATRELVHIFYRGFVRDPDLFMDMSLFSSYHYDPQWADAYFERKLQGSGTQAERLAVRYAFEKLGMTTVLADAVAKNTRSQHVLEKVGFQLIRQDENFKYYRITRNSIGPIKNASHGAMLRGRRHITHSEGSLS